MSKVERWFAVFLVASLVSTGSLIGGCKSRKSLPRAGTRAKKGEASSSLRGTKWGKKIETMRVKGNRLVRLFDEGVRLAKQGHHTEAVYNFQEFLRLDSEHAVAHYELGKSEMELGRTQEAEAMFRSALELMPDLSGAHFRLGLLYAKQERYTAAEREFREELALSPGEPSLLYNLALAIYEQEKFPEAIPWLEMVSELVPEKAEVYWKLAEIYDLRGEPEKASAQYERFAQANPGEADLAYYNIGVEAFNQRKREKAILAFRKALEVNPEHAEAHRQIGYCLIGMGEFPGAVGHFDRYIELKPNGRHVAEIRQVIAQLSE